MPDSTQIHRAPLVVLKLEEISRARLEEVCVYGIYRRSGIEPRSALSGSPVWENGRWIWDGLTVLSGKTPVSFRCTVTGSTVFDASAAVEFR